MNINEYNFEPNLNYLIYYRGGFAPPTKGHFSLVEKYDLENVHYFVHQIGERHNIPYEINRKIFKMYLRLLKNDRITLERMGPSLDVLKHIENIDVVIYLKGAETAEPLTYKEGRKIYKRLKERFRPLITELRKKDVKFEFLFIDRPKADRLSATKFVEI